MFAAAAKRAAECTCGIDASCDACLRTYSNQFMHGSLNRGPVAAYLLGLLEDNIQDPMALKTYTLPDPTGTLYAAIRNARTLDVVAASLTADGPPEVGPWYLALLSAAARTGATVRLAVGETQGDPLVRTVLSQAGVHLAQINAGAPLPEVQLLAVDYKRRPNRCSLALAWLTLPTVNSDWTHHELRSAQSLPRLTTDAAALDAWFDQYTTPVVQDWSSLWGPDVIVHPLRKNEPARFDAVVATVKGRTILKAVLQDPYLRNKHQVEMLLKFLMAVFPRKAGPQIPLTLITQLAEAGKEYFPAEQKLEIEKRLTLFPELVPDIQTHPARYRPHRCATPGSN